MNKGFVYKGILVLFDEKLGWFLYRNGSRLVFGDKEICKDFINKKLNTGITYCKIDSYISV
jgi:hypothetical protein